MDTDDAVKLVDLLEQLATDYPSQPEWQELAVRVRKEMNTTRRSPDETNRLPEIPGNPADGQCFVCKLSPAVSETSMCADCAAMYGTISSRAVPGSCDCGHSATSRRVFIYHKGRTERTLCSRSCLTAHFKEEFRVFLGGSA
jgi:hypothetical protein